MKFRVKPLYTYSTALKQFASPKSEAISLLILVFCSQSSSFNSHTHTLCDARSEFRVDFLEVLELFLFGCLIACTKVASKIVHSALSHTLVKDLVEQVTRLCVDVVRVVISISADWSISWLVVNGVCFVCLHRTELTWFVVWSLSIAVQVHDSVSLIVSGSKSCSEWAVDWNLMVVGSKTMSVGVSVIDESSLQHLAVRCFNAWNEMGRSKCGLLSFRVEVLRISIQGKLSNLDQWNFGLWPNFGNIVDIPMVLLTLFKCHDLYIESP